VATYTDLTCAVCQSVFSRLLKTHTYELKRKNGNYRPICSLECKKKFRSTKIEVECDNCGKNIEKQEAQVNKTEHNFCSRSCSVSFNNRKISRSKLPDKLSHCIKCEKEIKIKANASHKIAYCDGCKPPPNTAHVAVKKIKLPITCVMCGELVSSTWSKRKYCGVCIHIAQRNAGLKSVAAQAVIRRSKNEIYFAELCQQFFDKVSTNDPIFISKYGNWDADVIIHDHKIAILWNGIWHSKKVRAKHSVKQVQARDKIKIDVIKENGYTPYSITDLGKHNKAFVEEEFQKLKRFLIIE
jgi:hypothetical protein